MMNYSESFQNFEGEIDNVHLQETLAQLRILNRDIPLNILKWDEFHIAVTVKVPVELPPLGNAGGMDIRSEEPVVLVFNLKRYPAVAPRAYPDRLDFPKASLSHLYVARPGKPPAFCLVRGGTSGFNEWYANKRVADILIRTSNWLRDSASGQLSTNGDEFEPLRLEGYRGTFFYDYSVFEKLITDDVPFCPGGDFARVRMEQFDQNDNQIGLRYDQVMTPDNFEELITEMQREDTKGKNDPTRRNFFQGFLVWSKSEKAFDHYQVDLPRNWQEFKEFCNQFDINTDSLEQEISNNNRSLYLGIAVTVGIKRPHNIIGFSGDIEFLNFVLVLPEGFSNSNPIPGDATVFFASHSQPLTAQKAKDISGFYGNMPGLSLVAGCGALGSRVVLHLQKSGTGSFFLYDPDRLAPHNFVRHPLSAKYLNRNKASALAEEGRRIIPELASFGINVEATEEAFKLFGSLIPEWILDFTASTSFGHVLTKGAVNPSTKVARALISDFGNLGLMYIEGKGRNPRIDDLEVSVYDAAMNSTNLASWLKREAGLPEKTSSVYTGIGCASETTVLADDILALHASIFSGVLKGSSNHEQPAIGRVYLNEITYEPFFQNNVSQLEFKPFDVFQAINKADWEIRFANGIIEALQDETNDKSPNETGGVFIGRVNYKTQTVHVTGIIKAPVDSRANPACFFRGAEGLPDAIDNVTNLTGGQLGYIGEWHSHPNGPEFLSATDRQTVERFRAEFENLNPPLPVFLLIVTSKNILPYIF